MSRQKVAHYIGVKIRGLCRDQKRASGMVRRIFLTVGFFGNKSHFVPIWADPSLSLPQMALEISCSKHQWDTQDLCGDSRQQVRSANLSRL